jgi:hypothetical protein
MNSIKPFFLGTLLLIFGSSLSAQSFAIKAGLNMANISYSEASGSFIEVDTDTEARTTFHAGITADFPIGNVLSFQTGLIYQNRGFKQETSETVEGITANGTSTLEIVYLDIPLTLKANFEIGSLSAYAYGGGYVGAALSGQTKVEIDAAGFSFSDSFDLEFGEGGMVSRLDYGGLVGAGLQFDSIFVEVSYALGLANIIQDPIDDESVNNRVFAISAGYRFN